MNEDQNPKTPTVPAIQVVEIKSFDDLEALSREPVIAEILIKSGTGTKLVKIPCLRLSQPMMEVVEALRRKAQAPFNPQRKEYDLINPEYLTQRDHNERVARNYMAYVGCPSIASKAPNLTDPEAINKFVRENVVELIAAVIAATVEGGGLIEVIRRANFTSTPDLAS